MSAQPPEIDRDLITEGAGIRDDTGQARMWRACLALLLSDARAYWLNKPHQPGALSRDLEQAFDDVTACGPMTRQVCDWTGFDPEYVSAAFIRWCEDGASLS